MGYHINRERQMDRKRERQMDRKREKEEDAVIYEKGGYKPDIDVENVETTGERCCHLS